MKWSHSALTTFEQCPNKYYHLHHVRDVEDVPGEAAIKGQQDHKSLEDRLTIGAELPAHLKHLEPVIKIFEQHELSLHVEHEIIINEKLEAGTKDDRWAKGILDVFLNWNNGLAAIFDWKTGKPHNDFSQLKLYAAMAMVKYPSIHTCKVAYIWLKTGEIDEQIIRRHEVANILHDYQLRVQEIDDAAAENDWPAMPGWYCKFCPAKHVCPQGR